MTQQNEKIRAIEQLEGITSVIQEDGEEIRRFAASTGTCYFPSCHMILRGSPEQRVLFWQQGMRLSAPEIHIRDAVQGFGDIRLLFEKNDL